MNYLFLFAIFCLALVVEAVNKPLMRLNIDSPKNLATCRENCYIQIKDPNINIWCKTFGSQGDCRQIIMRDLQKRENKLPNGDSKLLLEQEKLPYGPSRFPAKNPLIAKVPSEEPTAEWEEEKDKLDEYVKLALEVEKQRLDAQWDDVKPECACAVGWGGKDCSIRLIMPPECKDRNSQECDKWLRKEYNNGKPHSGVYTFEARHLPPECEEDKTSRECTRVIFTLYNQEKERALTK